MLYIDVVEYKYGVEAGDRRAPGNDEVPMLASLPTWGCEASMGTVISSMAAGLSPSSRLQVTFQPVRKNTRSLEEGESPAVSV